MSMLRAALILGLLSAVGPFAIDMYQYKLEVQIINKHSGAKIIGADNSNSNSGGKIMIREGASFKKNCNSNHILNRQSCFTLKYRFGGPFNKGKDNYLTQIKCSKAFKVTRSECKYIGDMVNRNTLEDETINAVNNLETYNSIQVQGKLDELSKRIEDLERGNK